jgi:hypothetical protein
MIAFMVLQPIQTSRRGRRTARSTAPAIASGW